MYGGYCVPESSRHRPAAQKILSNGVYEPETIRFIRANCGAGDIVHAGTYFGDFLPALSKALAPEARIWAFEPNTENYRCARITVEINGLKNVVLANSGLGARAERMQIMTVDQNGHALGGASRLVPDVPEGMAHTQSVQVVTVDEVVGPDRNVSILQLDVEGHEKEALAGALKTIRRCLPIIILETLPESILLRSAWFAENVLGLGYRPFGKVHGNVIYVRESKDDSP
jgi:FkbM family methyltransferase